MQVVDASGNMFGYDSITVAGPDGRPKTISTAIKLVTLVRNTSGATITKGTVVYINGGSGNKPTIAKALATSDATSAQTYGVVQANIPNNKNGYVVVIGALDGLNTSAYSPGTQLYLSSTVAGEWTSTRQLAPAHLVYVAIVTRQHVNQGVIEVKIQNGYELDEIHDVQITSPTNGQTLIYDSSTSLWKNGSGGGGASWGGITGTLSSQTDLQTALDAKQDDLVSGANIKTINGSSVLGSGDLVVSGGSGLQGAQIQFNNNGNQPNFGFNAAMISVSSTTVIPTASRLDVYPITPNRTLTNVSLTINVATLGVGSLARLVVYSNSNSFPTTKLYESTSIDCSTTGDKTVLTGLTFDAGTTYWLGFYSNGIATFRAIATTALLPIFWPSATTPSVAWSRINTALGTAPTTFNYNTYSSTGQINILIKST